MLDLVKYLVTTIVDHQDKVKVNQTVDESQTQIITINVDPEDMGKVIGKGGKIINSIRELAKVKAIKQGLRVRVILEDQMKTDQPSLSEPSAIPSHTP
ncbi:MAG: KH domain-containing protein [Candidatus Beckwithbacteria bacterium]|nr:KH domain-containing protein [Patescibacteria group bacterium]